MQAENKNFWINLGEIQDALFLSDKDFSDYLGISYAHYTKQKNAFNFLPLTCIYECAEKLNFHFEDLLQDSFSTKTILSKTQGNYSLPEKYSVATYSSTRPIINLLTYIAREKGERARINLFRKFQISESFLNKPDQKTNILLISDAVQYLTTTFQLKPADLLAIGQMTPFTSINADIAAELNQKKNIYEILDYFFSELAHRFDKNFTYKINTVYDSYAIVEAMPNKQVIEELELNPEIFGNEQGCFTRMGVLSSVTWYRYKCFADVKKISSIYNGDKTNLYLFDLSPFQKLRLIDNKDPGLKTIWH